MKNKQAFTWIELLYPAPISRIKTLRDDEARGGFTLIELLVVVLIIGILAAVALPQYQVAVKKTNLAKYTAIVKALKEAEDVYFLANGTFTLEIDDLDVAIPHDNSCTKGTSTAGQYYDCGNSRYGVFKAGATTPTNAQAGDDSVRYLQFFDETISDGKNIYKDDIVCYSKGKAARQACRSLGPGEEWQSSGSWDYKYVIR